MAVRLGLATALAAAALVAALVWSVRDQSGDELAATLWGALGKVVLVVVVLGLGVFLGRARPPGGRR